MKKYLRTVATAFTAFFLIAGVAFAQQPTVVSPESTYLGMSYGDWSAAWWQFMIETPNANAVFGDDSSPGGYDCNMGQTLAPVFFLFGGGSQNSTANRTCKVPAGKAIFFPIINAECSTVEGPPFYGGSEYALRTCAASWGNATVLNTLKVTVDGFPLPNLKNMRAQSPAFTFTAVPTGNLGVEAKGLSVSDGFWVLLKPLSRGKHTIHFEATAPSVGNYQSVNYNLTVE